MSEPKATLGTYVIAAIGTGLIVVGIVYNVGGRLIAWVVGP